LVTFEIQFISEGFQEYNADNIPKKPTFSNKNYCDSKYVGLHQLRSRLVNLLVVKIIGVDSDDDSCSSDVTVVVAAVDVVVIITKNNI